MCNTSSSTDMFSNLSAGLETDEALQSQSPLLTLQVGPRSESSSLHLLLWGLVKMDWKVREEMEA